MEGKDEPARARATQPAPHPPRLALRRWRPPPKKAAKGSWAAACSPCSCSWRGGGARQVGARPSRACAASSRQDLHGLLPAFVVQELALLVGQYLRRGGARQTTKAVPCAARRTRRAGWPCMPPTSNACVTSRNFSLAASSPLFLSGWYFTLSLRYARLICLCVASRGTARTAAGGGRHVRTRVPPPPTQTVKHACRTLGMPYAAVAGFAVRVSGQRRRLPGGAATHPRTDPVPRGPRRPRAAPARRLATTPCRVA